ncbi:MFS transporter [Oceanobacter mangrovi]|uniref:MFS transporter n=1 Tax=Oceanobacter mangrovi TaxID=2862510 RepID=UPI001C8DE4E4|nr:MFS transporter [Oceanobacter mangrovi]
MSFSSGNAVSAGGHNLTPSAVKLILFALTVGGFGIGTGEFAIMGLMPFVASDLQVTEPQVGHLISAYALGVVVGAPMLAFIGARFQRRTLLLLLMGCFAFGNFASALTSDYNTLMIFRFIAGLPHGAYFGVASLVAASLVSPDQRAKAVAMVVVGLTVAMLIGNPLASWVGQTLDWRVAFAFVGAVAVLTVVLTLMFLPGNPNEPRGNPIAELKDFNNANVWLALLIGSIGFSGMFCVASYVAPTLQEVTAADKSWIPLAMAAFGLGAIIGNYVGGWLFDKLQFRAVGILLLWSAVVLFLYPLATASITSIMISCVTIGTMVSLSAPLQTHLMDIAGEAQTLAAASNQSAFNVANALGPWLGGLAISAGLGWQSTGYIGTATAVAAIVVFWIADRNLTREVNA